MNIKPKWLLVLAAMAFNICFVLADYQGKDTNPVSRNQQLASLESNMQKAEAFYQNKEYKKAAEYYELALTEAKQDKQQEQLNECLIKLGRCYQRLSDFPKALTYFFQFKDQPSAQKKAENIAKVNRYVASIYQKLGDYEKSFNYHLEALHLCEKNKDSIGIARCFYDLGYLFFYQDQFERARDYFDRAYEIYQKQDNEKKIFHCLSAIGCIYGSIDSLETALDYQFQALNLARKLDIKPGEATTLHNIGVYYSLGGRYELGLDYLYQGLERRKALGDQWGQIGSHKYIGDHFILVNNPQKAIIHLQEGLKLSNELGTKTRHAELFLALAQAYAKMSNYDKSNEYWENYATLKDSLMGERVAAELGASKTKYEVLKKQSEIAALKDKNTLLKQNQKIETLQYKVLLFGITLLLLFIISGFLSYHFYSQRSLNQMLGEKNEQIRSQNEELAFTNKKMEITNQKLAFTNKRLEFSNQELKRFAYIASHDLKAPLRTIGSFTSLLKRRYGHLFDETAKEYMEFIVGGAKYMHQLLEDLLAYSRIEKDQGFEKWLDTREIVHNALTNLQYNIEKRGATIDIEEAALPKIKGNPSLMTQLFQNIISNGIKFTDNHPPHIQIGCITNGKNYTFAISDNGIGIEEAFSNKIFDMFSRLHVPGVYEGTGIGLATCKKIIKGYGGDIWVESKIGEGSTFYFTLPKDN